MHDLYLANRLEASRRAETAPNAAERYRWIGVWWRLFAKQTADPIAALGYSRNMFRLSADMNRRPQHYLAKPPSVTDFQHSQLETKA